MVRVLESRGSKRLVSLTFERIYGQRRRRRVVEEDVRKLKLERHRERRNRSTRIIMEGVS